MTVRSETQSSRLRASEAACLLFIAEGTDQTVASLAAHIGLSERTFYRYFSTREQVIRPVLEHGIATVASTFAAEPLTDSFMDVAILGFERTLWGDHADYTRRLVPLLLQDTELYAVWLSTIRDFEAALLPLVAARLGVSEESLRAHLATAALVSAMRVSFEHPSEDPAGTMSEALALLGDGIFTRGS